MSSIRDCDRCGGIFSENEEDWSTYSGTRNRRDKTSGRRFTEQVDQDACPQCSTGQPPLKSRPKLPLSMPFGGPPPADDRSEAIAELERGEILDRLAAVERTAGLGSHESD